MEGEHTHEVEGESHTHARTHTHTHTTVSNNFMHANQFMASASQFLLGTRLGSSFNVSLASTPNPSCLQPLHEHEG